MNTDNAMKRLDKIYNSAEAVASLWMLSFMFPLFILPSDQVSLLVNILGYIIFVIIAVTLSRYRRNEIEMGRWKTSDLVVYFIVPACLFIFTLSMFLFASDN